MHGTGPGRAVGTSGVDHLWGKGWPRGLASRLCHVRIDVVCCVELVGVRYILVKSNKLISNSCMQMK